jgi:hypothetical protein
MTKWQVFGICSAFGRRCVDLVVDGEITMAISLSCSSPYTRTRMRLDRNSFAEIKIQEEEKASLRLA